MLANDLTASRGGTEIKCRNCRWSRSCWPGGFSSSIAETLGPIVRQSGPLPAGTILFRQGDPLSSLYIVMVGSVKTYLSESDGEQQILRFNLPGELLGLEALGNPYYTSTAEALEPCVVCALPLGQLEALWDRRPAIRTDIFRRLADVLAQSHALVLNLAQRDAEARLAAFLLSLSDRMLRRGLSPDDIRLSMLRRDIGNFLGINQETVSRLFARFQQAQLISVNGRSIQLHDLEALRAVATASAR